MVTQQRVRDLFDDAFWAQVDLRESAFFWESHERVYVFLFSAGMFSSYTGIIIIKYPNHTNTSNERSQCCMAKIIKKYRKLSTHCSQTVDNLLYFV